MAEEQQTGMGNYSAESRRTGHRAEEKGAENGFRRQMYTSKQQSIWHLKPRRELKWVDRVV